MTPNGLKEKGMEGKKKREIKFRDWCEKDVNDARKINYELHRLNKVERFTSEDLVEPDIMKYLNLEAVIVSRKLRNNEWHITLR